jgi:uncharacterized SAM-binding protein YcdF (DUF218 family)
MSYILVPSGFAYLLALLGLSALAWRRFRRHGCWLLGASAATTLVFSSGIVSVALIAPLEYAFPTVHSATEQPELRSIVVLTGYAADVADMPLTGRLGYSSAMRINMTLQLKHTCASCRVIVSGSTETAKVMGEVLLALGVPPDQLVIEDDSLTTADSATNLRALLRTEPFFLVTSAGHMTRSMRVMQKAGLDPVAAPTDHTGPRRWQSGQLLPGPGYLQVSDYAMHEYLGLVWYRMRGAI